MNSVAEWISIPNASGYQVSLKGTVRSVDRYVPCGKGTRLAAGCELKPYRTPKGYLVVTITDDDRRRADIGVHVLVCTAAHGPKPTPAHEVRHLNGDPGDNRAENLAWGTKSENAFDTV